MLAVLETGFALAAVCLVALIVLPPLVKLMRKYIAWMMKD